jgi:hypothetical protein
LELKDAVLGIALNGANRRQFLAVGLGDVEHIGCAEASHGGRTFSRFFVLFFFPAKHGRQNHDPLLSLLDVTAQLIPGAESGDMTGVGFLRSDEHHIVQAVAMKAADSLEIAGKSLAVALLQRIDKLLGGLLGEFLDLF